MTLDKLRIPALVATTMLCGAQTPQGGVEKIGERLQSALNSPEGKTTQGQIAAYREAELGYAREVERIYSEILEMLDSPEAKIAFKGAQARWIEFRDSQLAANQSSFAAPAHLIERNKLNAPLVAKWRVSIVRMRAEELSEYWVLAGLEAPGPGRHGFISPKPPNHSMQRTSPLRGAASDFES